ncbi:MAG: DUF3857 domain-containing protein [Saprospiraceae bacterium]
MKACPKLNHSPFLLSLFFLISLSTTTLSAQKDYKWEDWLAPSKALSAKYENEDAVIIYDYEKRQTLLNNSLFFARNILKRRIKILTQRGLERYGKIVIPKKQDLQITILDTRTIKQDGSLVDHAAKDIKSLDLTDEEDIYDREKYLLFSVPGLEVGDEFELVCVYEGETIQRGNNVYLNDFLPILKSTFILEVDKKVIVLTNVYNGMSDPKMEQGLENYSFSWEVEDLPGLYDDNGIIPSLQLPYFIYELNLNRFYVDSAPPDIQNWRDLLQYVDQQSLKVIVRKSKKLRRLYEEILGEQQTASPVEQLQRIHQFINDEVKLQRISSSEESSGIEYFIEERKADYHVLLKMYKTLLDRLGLKYYLASCKNRYHGPVKLNFPSSIQITDYTFVVEDANNNFHLVFPKTPDRQYEMDEIPPFLEGTSLYLLDLQDTENFKEIKIPLSPYQKNKRLHKIKTTVNLAEQSVQQKCQESFEGAASSQVRNFYAKKKEQAQLASYLGKGIEKRFPNAKLENLVLSENADQFPFKFTLDYDVSIPAALTKMDEGIYKINIEQWFPHQLYQTNSNTRLLHYYPLFTGIDAFSYYLSFDQAVELVNKNNIDQTVKTPIGTYEVSINQINEKMLVLRSKYILKNHKILNTEMTELQKLNDAAKQADETGIIIQLVTSEKK